MNDRNSLILLSNPGIRLVESQISELIDRIEKGGCRAVLLDENKETFAFLGDRISVLRDDDEIRACRAALVLGGDGSILEAAHRLIGLDVPIVGINFGHVGFLAQMEMADLSLLDNLLSGDYCTEERMMLDAAVYDANGALRESYTVLNDIVVASGSVARLISYDLICDHVKAQHCRADGVIAATPTGSTAYSLSAGGPVLDPSLDCICLTPICPHTLSSRPAIFSSATEIKIEHIDGRGSDVYLCADGRATRLLEEGDSIVLTKSHYVTRLLRLKDRVFLHVLSSKLSDK